MHSKIDIKLYFPFLLYRFTFQTLVNKKQGYSTGRVSSQQSLSLKELQGIKYQSKFFHQFHAQYAGKVISSFISLIAPYNKLFHFWDCV